MGNTSNTIQTQTQTQILSKDNKQIKQSDQNIVSDSLLSNASSNFIHQPNLQYGTLFETTWKTESVFGGTKHAYSHDVFLTGYQINEN